MCSTRRNISNQPYPLAKKRRPVPVISPVINIGAADNFGIVDINSFSLAPQLGPPTIPAWLACTLPLSLVAEFGNRSGRPERQPHPENRKQEREH